MSELDDELAAIDEQIALEAEVTALFVLRVAMGLIHCLHNFVVSCTQAAGRI